MFQSIGVNPDKEHLRYVPGKGYQVQITLPTELREAVAMIAGKPKPVAQLTEYVQDKTLPPPTRDDNGKPVYPPAAKRAAAPIDAKFIQWIDAAKKSLIPPRVVIRMTDRIELPAPWLRLWHQHCLDKLDGPLVMDDDDARAVLRSMGSPMIDVTPKPTFIAYSEIVRLWAISLDTPPSKKGREAMETKMKRLAEFMQGRPYGSIKRAEELTEFDAYPITTADLLAYRLHMIEMKNAGIPNPKDPKKRIFIASKTIEDHVSMLRQLFKAAYNAGKLTTNPAADDRFTYYGERTSMRGGGVFTENERRTIYKHLHEAPPVVKMMNLTGLWFGPRNAEVAELTTYDIEGAAEGAERYPGDDGKPVLHIRLTHRPKEHKVKTDVTPRPLPLPEAWAAEAVAIRDAVIATHGHGPLFPEIPLDSDGRRNDNATTIVNDWLRSIGIKGKTYYAHRQTFKTLARSPVMAEETAEAISGHANGKASRNYGYYEMWKMRAAIECETFNGIVT